MKNSTLKKIVQFVLFTGIGAVILFLVYRSQNKAYQEQCRLDGVAPEDCNLIEKLLTDFSSVDPLWMFMVVAAFTVSNLFRAYRWNMLLEPMGYRARFVNSFLTILLGYFANLGLPRMGEVVRAGSLSRYERIPLEKVMGTLVVDRLMDFVCLGLVVGLAFVFEADTVIEFINNNRGEGGGSILGNRWVQIALAAMALGLVGFLVFRKRLMQLSIVKRIFGLIEGFLEGLRSVFRLRRAWLFILLSLGIWVMFYLQCWFNLEAFPPTEHLGPSPALMIFVLGTLGFVIPSPGGLGSFHYLAIAALSLYAIDGADALSYSMIAFFAIQIFYNVVGGLLALILLPILNKNKEVPNEQPGTA